MKTRKKSKVLKRLKVIIESGENNYSAYIEEVGGIGVVGDTIEEIKKNMREAVEFYIDVAKEDGSQIPEQLQGEYEFEFVMDAQTLLNYYDGILGKLALEKLTGINQKQLWHYAMGKRKPRAAQREKIQRAFNRLGEELLMVRL